MEGPIDAATWVAAAATAAVASLPAAMSLPLADPACSPATALRSSRRSSAEVGRACRGTEAGAAAATLACCGQRGSSSWVGEAGPASISRSCRSRAAARVAAGGVQASPAATPGGDGRRLAPGRAAAGGCSASFASLSCTSTQHA